MMAGKIPAFFLPVTGKSTKEVAAGSALPGHAGHGLVGFQLCGRRVVCGLCRASILAGLAGMQGYASPLRSPGPSFPSAVIFRSFTRSGFAVSPSNSRQPCASGCGFPCALCIPALSPGFYGGTAPPGAAEHVTMEDSGMSVVAPAVYVGTWHKYNCGSIAGRWFDLTTFDDERDFFAACRALHQDEADSELMFQDYEGFPGNMASECHINWAWVEGFRQARDEGCEEAYRLWVEDTGETDFDTFRDAWWGEADSEEAFAVEFASDTGLLADVPETVALYFDYEAYARDLFLDSFTFIDGHVFRR